METSRDRQTVGGIDLRYVLTWYLVSEGPLTVSRMVGLLDRDGITVRGRPSKTVSDALRWEIARRRVTRLSRSTYTVGIIPRSTARRIDARVRELRQVLR